jgi:hypothetical protein
MGALMLSEKMKKDARPVMGSAFFRVHDPSETVLSYSRLVDGVPTSDKDSFHCWVECDGFLIDFTAPVFRESLAQAGKNLSIQRKMLQKPFTTMADSVNDLKQEGDFCLYPDQSLTNQLLKSFLEKPAPSDLANICLHWLQKPVTKTPTDLSMVNDLGERTDMTLPNINLQAAW